MFPGIAVILPPARVPIARIFAPDAATMIRFMPVTASLRRHLAENFRVIARWVGVDVERAPEVAFHGEVSAFP